MAEQTLNEPLHGNEIVEAILDRLRAKLRMDCFLNPNSNYDHFSADITISLVLHDQGIDLSTSAQATIEQGVPLDPETEVEEITANLEIPPQPPNVVREETGQPIPVVSTNSRGKAEIKRVTYQRPAKTAAKRTAAKAVGVVLALCMMPHLRAQQAAKPPATAPVPPGNPAALTDTEVIAIKSVATDYRRVQAEIEAVERDVARAHPGYRLNVQNGELVPIPPPPSVKPAAPAKVTTNPH